MCEYCNGGISNNKPILSLFISDKRKGRKSMNYCGTAQLRIARKTENLPPLIDIYGTDSQYSFEIAYCPMCGEKL
jgi:hypothetical protein